jgi:hypothetical protein
VTGRAIPASRPDAEPSSRRAAVAALLDERRLFRPATSGNFTPQEILEALRTWAERHGEAPRGIDWDPARARLKGQAWRAERFDEGRWPTLAIVRRQFGTWSAAVLSAGLRPHRGPFRPRGRTLSDADILEAIRTWTARYGEPPAWADWSPARARRQSQEWRVQRYLSGDWPSSNTVARRFGTFTAAVAAAGITPRPRGRHTGAKEPLPARTRLVLSERFAVDALGSGPGTLAARVRTVARTRAAYDPAGLRNALIDLASAALAWADAIDVDSREQQVDAA